MDERSVVIESVNVKKYFPITTSLARKVIGNLKAVDGITFRIKEGKSLALAGESGCGKTTTAKMILRLEKPTSGSILWNGIDITKLNKNEIKIYHQTVSAVFQDPTSSLNPRMRVKDLISEPMVVNNRSLQKGDIAGRVSELLLEVGMRPEDANLYPHEFSGGQRQRIAIARALGTHPKLIILDEPVSSIDVSMRSGIMNLLKDLSRKHGVSYLLIAHDFSTIRFLGDDIAIMYLGQIIEQGPSRDICWKPLHPYAQGLIASSVIAKAGQGIKIVLRGEVGSPANPPRGCHFHPRCPFVRDICSKEAPAYLEVIPGRWVACHLYTACAADVEQVESIRSETLVKNVGSSEISSI